MGLRSNSSGVIGSFNQRPVQPAMIDAPYDAPRPRSTVKVVPASIDNALSQRIQSGGPVSQAPAPTEGDKTRSLLTDQESSRTKAQLALAGANYVTELMNASTQYANIEGQTRFNILQSKNQEADARYRGRQAAMVETSQGAQQVEDATLALAAQGQNIQGAGAQKVLGSYEAIAAQNAAQAEINGMREALGFQLEQLNMDYQLDIARTNRDQQYIASTLNFGAQAAGAAF